MSASRATLQAPHGSSNPFPPTRYQGSKRRLAAAIVGQLSELRFRTVLDAFGGTAAVAYAFKQAGKLVTYNDVLAFNHQIGRAMIENDTVRLPEEQIAVIGERRPGVTYGDFVERTFEGIYFTAPENRWLDTAVANIRSIEHPHQRAIAWFALFQSAMAKRPYNLFHRCNLYMRSAEVPRSFGNKASWDRSFDEHFRRFTAQANAALYDSGGICRAMCADAIDVEPGFDLVYIDPPYINRAGVGVDYRDFYHFLEGLVHYPDWPVMVDHSSRHRRLDRRPDPWSDPGACHEAFRRLLHRFAESILVISYRSEGTPSIDGLADMLAAVKRRVRVVELGAYQYALSGQRDSREMLLIGSD